jgi:hypothetical protein
LAYQTYLIDFVNDFPVGFQATGKSLRVGSKELTMGDVCGSFHHAGEEVSQLKKLYRQNLPVGSSFAKFPAI